MDRGLVPPPLKWTEKVPWMDCIEKYVDNVRILHLDAYNHGLFSQKEKLKYKKDRNSKKEVEDKKHKSVHGHGFVSNNIQVRPYNSVRKRSMSTVHETEVKQYEDCHVKAVKEMQSGCNAEV